MRDFKLDLLSHRSVFHENVQVSECLYDVANIELILDSLLSSLVKAHIFTNFVAWEATEAIWEEWPHQLSKEQFTAETSFDPNDSVHINF